jgi:hypothetical protein
VSEPIVLEGALELTRRVVDEWHTVVELDGVEVEELIRDRLEAPERPEERKGQVWLEAASLGRVRITIEQLGDDGETR